MMVSREFFIALKLADQPAYRICQAAGVNPTTLSKLIHGCTPLKSDDPRILAVAKQLGISPKEAFADEGGGR